MAKALGGGYQPIGAVMISEKIVLDIKEGKGSFIHGQTYQSMPVQAAAALEVQRIIKKDKLIENIQKQGLRLEHQLKKHLEDHPNVGDIRGQGLFWGIEFVKNKLTKETFDPKNDVAHKILDKVISEPYNMTIYPGTGCAGGIKGDHIIIAPPFTITEKEVDEIVRRITAVIFTVFIEQVE